MSENEIQTVCPHGFGDSRIGGYWRKDGTDVGFNEDDATVVNRYTRATTCVRNLVANHPEDKCGSPRIHFVERRFHPNGKVDLGDESRTFYSEGFIASVHPGRLAQRAFLPDQKEIDPTATNVDFFVDYEADRDTSGGIKNLGGHHAGVMFDLIHPAGLTYPTKIVLDYDPTSRRHSGLTMTVFHPDNSTKAGYYDKIDIYSRKPATNRGLTSGTQYFRTQIGRADIPSDQSGGVFTTSAHWNAYLMNGLVTTAENSIMKDLLDGNGRVQKNKNSILRDHSHPRCGYYFETHLSLYSDQKHRYAIYDRRSNFNF